MKNLVISKFYQKVKSIINQSRYVTDLNDIVLLKSIESLYFWAVFGPDIFSLKYYIILKKFLNLIHTYLII